MTYQNSYTTRSYSGQSGCMCGCLGKYNDHPIARKKAWNRLMKNSDMQVDAWSKVDSDGDAGCI